MMTALLFKYPPEPAFEDLPNWNTVTSEKYEEAHVVLRDTFGRKFGLLNSKHYLWQEITPTQLAMWIALPPHRDIDLPDMHQPVTVTHVATDTTATLFVREYADVVSGTARIVIVAVTLR